MKKQTLAIIALCLALCAVLCSCTLDGNMADTSDITQGNAPVTGEKKTENDSTTLPETTVVAKPETTTAKANSNGVTGKPDSSSKTYTGYAPLPKITLTASDPNNTRGLSTTTVGYSYGVSQNGVPHDNSLNAQKYFIEKKFDAVSIDTKTKEKVLYLTFDCGWENGYTSKVLNTLKEKQVPAAFFCTLSNIKAEPELTARMIKEGHIVGNHSTTHPDFSKIDRTQMAKEIEECDNYLREHFGYTSKFFRFPAGSYSDSALDLVSSVGFKSVFWSVAYADWDVSDIKGKEYAFKTVTSRLHPGAIILLHSVSPDNAEALGDIIDWARQQGYEFRALTQFPK
ncbi:MAG: polysaccharide deacetylase family protein [Clostridia bacterium]|nr:polysaccharide deacetylase family protein [Clostridia bacterium]